MYAVASQGQGPDAPVADRFGRAGYFALFDGDGNFLKTLSNDTSEVQHGAGSRAASLVASEGAAVVIGPKPGPNAETVLKNQGIKFFPARDCTASQAVRKCMAELGR